VAAGYAPYTSSETVIELERNASRTEKRTAQLSAHPQPYLRSQVIMRAAMVERTADCNKVRENVVRLNFLYLGKHEFFFRYFTVSPYPLKGSLDYIFSGLLIWMQYVKSICG